MKLFNALISIFSISGFCQAGLLPAPTGETILSVTGKIQHTQDGDSANFDLDALKALDSDSFDLQTRWSNKNHTYYGPLLTAILDKVGATGKLIHLIALDDYIVKIDRRYIEKYQPIIAWAKDGKKMLVRDKGPLRLMLPHHKYPELTTEEHSGNMIWQLRRIEVK